MNHVRDGSASSFSRGVDDSLTAPRNGTPAFKGGNETIALVSTVIIDQDIFRDEQQNIPMFTSL